MNPVEPVVAGPCVVEAVNPLVVEKLLLVVNGGWVVFGP